ncbi:MAG: hypothetical protein HY905_20390 [Deltaproteobacteria bacterium]|nr:hypothetical protein [Deltaproteobacteria bacterium]
MGKSARRPSARRSSGTKPAELRLDAEVYSDAAIERARRAFEGLAAIEVRRSGRCHLVRFSKVSPDAAERLPDEFGNYALSCLLVNP